MPHSAEPGSDAAIALAHAQRVHGGFGRSAWFNAGGSLAYALITWPANGWAALLAFGGLAAFYALRVQVFCRGAQPPTPERAGAAAWRRRYLAWCAGLGLYLGLAAVLLHRGGDTAHTGVLAVVLTTSALLAVPVYALVPAALWAYLPPLMLPYGLLLVAAGEPGLATLGWALLAATVLLLGIGHLMARQAREQTALLLERERLSTALALQLGQLDASQRLRDRYLRRISHVSRQPLQTMQTCIGLLGELGLPAPMVQRLQQCVFDMQTVVIGALNQGRSDPATLPARRPGSVGIDAAPGSDAPQAHAILRLHGELLLVDNDPLVRESLTWMLTHWGLTCTAADSSERALALADARAQPWPVVLADWHLGGTVDGAEVLRGLHARGHGARCCALVTGEDLQRRFDLPPGALVLRKPLQANRLHALLRRAFEGQGPLSAAAAPAQAAQAVAVQPPTPPLPAA